MKSGFVAFIGRPNVGKSSLMNKILDYKVSIISSTPQTTRDQIKGIYNDDESQIIFLDTPGIHKPKQKLGDFLNETSFKTISDADALFILFPIDEKLGPGDKFILDKAKNIKNKTAIITKLDLGSPDEARTKSDELKKNGFENVIGVSTEIKKSIEHIINYIKDILPEGEPYYNREDITDRSMRFIAKELIRETAIENTKDEIPHSLAVNIDEFNEGDLIKIYATIFVERESQKGIVVGKDGSLIKKISMISRKKIEENINEKIFLKIRVKVNKNWSRDDKKIKGMGY